MESQRIDVVRFDGGMRSRERGKLDESTVQQTPFVLSRPLGCAIFSQIQVTTELWTRFVDPTRRCPGLLSNGISSVQGGTMRYFPGKKLASLSLSLSLSQIMKLVNNYPIDGLSPEAG